MILRVIVCCLYLLAPVLGFAAGDDFGTATKIDTEHFTIYYKSGVDINSLISQLHVSKTDQILANQMLNASSPESQLSSMIEILFTRAGDILDMHVPGLKVNIRIFATQQDLIAYYNDLFHANIPGAGDSFYLEGVRSIFMSAENLKREILGHEIGQAIMSRYFTSQPSARIQEVLSGYIQYQLRKSK